MICVMTRCNTVYSASDQLWAEIGHDAVYFIYEWEIMGHVFKKIFILIQN